MEIRSIGIDLGKTTFHLVALGRRGEMLMRRKFTQTQLLTYTANLQTCLIGLEACSGPHFLGRSLRARPRRSGLCSCHGWRQSPPDRARRNTWRADLAGRSIDYRS